MKIQESGEMYLESIYVLSKRQQYVRSIDISEYMGYSKPSVSRAVSLLRASGYILIDKQGYIALTESGRDIACKIYDRHVVLSKVLIRLGVDEQTAKNDACKIEHIISDKSFEAIKNHVSKK